jgi:hypothetical protein
MAMSLICPRCGSNRVHRSRRRDLAEKILAPAGARPRRCHGCDSRFVQIGALLIRVAEFRRAVRRATLGAGVLLAAVLVLAAILWIDRAQSNATPESLWMAPTGGTQSTLRAC